MDRSAQRTRAPDGRTVVFAEWGVPDGHPVIALHGTPGCRLGRHPNEALIASTGVRLVTIDRAGYGGSTRRRGRCVADCVGDVAAVADAVGFGRFAVTGGSGGGPHALAVAALLGERVTRAQCVVGVAPYAEMGESWFEGMDPQNVKEFGWALEGEDRLEGELVAVDGALRDRVAADPSTLLADFDLPDADRAVLARPDYQAVLRQTTVEQTRHGVGGWVDDDLALTRPWGFDPATIAVPTQIRYGTADVLVPPGHGRWLAGRVPGAEVVVGELGHMGDPDHDLLDRHAWLTQPA